MKLYLDTANVKKFQETANLGVLDGVTTNPSLVASVRHPQHVVEAALVGGHICTMPFSIFRQLVKHPLTGLCVKKFLVRTSRITVGHRAGCSKRPDISPAQPWRAETRLVPSKAAASEMAKAYASVR